MKTFAGIVKRWPNETWCALGAGLVMSMGLPPYRATGILVVLAMSLLFWALTTTDRPARTAWWFGLVHQGSCLYWLFLLDPAKSIPTRALVPVQALAAIAYVSLFYLLLGWAHGMVRRRLGAPRALLVLPVLWTLVEALRSRGELGFPWCLSGSAVIGSPLIGLARASGEIGVAAGLAFLAALAAALAHRRWVCGSQGMTKRQLGGLASGTLVLWLGLLVGARTVPEVPASHVLLADSLGVARGPVSVAAIQANVALADKWQKARLDSTLIPYRDLTERAAADGAELVVWAETAIPAYVRYDARLLAWLHETVSESGAWVLAAFPDAERDSLGSVATFNSAALFDPRGAMRARYAKHHLLPVGEVMPFTRVLPFLRHLDVGQAEWTAGPPPQPMSVELTDGGFRVSTLICFESAFAELARDAVRRGSQCLVVITNDGWFGRSAGPKQHAWLARLRAVECGVPLVRCANNGISFICDADGNVLDRLDLGRRGIVRADITPGTGQTLYVKYGAWPLFFFLAVWFVAMVAAPDKRLS